MNDFCKVRTKNLHDDMTNCLDVTGSANHFESTARFLRSDYSGLREFCDVRLRFENDSLMVHSVMLATFSLTFSEKFKKADKCFDVDLKFLKKGSVQKVLDFIYFGKVSFRFEALQDDLEAIAYFGIVALQEEVEKKLVVLAQKKNCVEVLNLVTFYLKTIPHSPSTMLAVSDKTVSSLVSILHNRSTSNQLSYEDVLKLSINTIITMLSSRIPDEKKIDIINIALKWIHERRLNDHKASNILYGLTFGSMTYAELVHFRSSLIQTVIPVTVGRCVRLKKGDNDSLDIVFTHADYSSHQIPNSTQTAISSFTLNNDPTSLGVSTVPTTLSLRSQNSSSSHTKFESGHSGSHEYNFDDCNTAMSFTAEDLKRLGFEKIPGQQQHKK